MQCRWSKMATSVVFRISSALARVENSIVGALSRFFPPGGPALALAGLNVPYIPSNTYDNILDVKSNSILAAVPRNRRSIERRLKRRFGMKDGIWKMLFQKKNLQTCITCGNWHEPGLLCPHCYNLVITETKEIRTRIEETLKLDPVDKEVVVLYENDNVGPEFFEGKRIVEMNKPRPVWFSKNLMQPSTQEPNEKVKDVKPVELA